MKKVILITICILIFTAVEASGRDEPLANKDKAGLYARSIEQVLRLDADEIDLATAALIVSEQWSDIVLGRNYLAELDNMAYEIRDRIKAKGIQTNYGAIPIIDEYLFEELGFKAIPGANEPNELFLHNVIDNKQGYCLGLSVLYLSLAERLGLPLYGVVVPRHFFVRYDDGLIRFNIETTSKGAHVPDEHYIEKFNIHEDSQNSIYMTNLNKIQTLGCFFNNLGNSYSEVGNSKQSMAAYEIAVELNPLLAESRGNLGNAYLKAGRTWDAIYQYQAALEINPDDAQTHYGLGYAYAEKGRLNSAISHFRQSLALDPNLIDAYKNLANAYCKQQMFAQAALQLKRAIALEPKDADCYSRLGGVYSEAGNCEEAIFQYETALKIEPDLAEAYCGLGICYKKLNLVNDAISAYKKALAIDPDMVTALGNLGNIHLDRQDYDAAIKLYKRALRTAPNDGMVHHALGTAYLYKTLYEQAIAEYLKAIEIDPKMAEAHNGLAFAFYRLKKYELAAKHIKIAEQLGIEIDKNLLIAIESNLK